MKGVTQPMRGRGTMLSAVAAAAALVALLAFAPFASAASDPLASGKTILTLNKGFYKKLKRNGIQVVRVKRGTVKNRTVTMIVVGGSLDPTTGKGTIKVNGGVKFKRGKRSVPFRVLTFDTKKNALIGDAGKKHMKLASFSGVTFSRDGFGTDIKVKTVKLTRSAAKQVNKRLGLSGKSRSNRRAAASSADANPVFKAGQVMGGVSNATQPKTVTVLAQDQAALIPNLATFGKFGEHGVNPTPGHDLNPISPAQEVPGPAFVFPLTGGTLAPDATSGTVNSGGGIAIKSSVNANTVDFNNLSLDFTHKTVLADNTVNGTLTGRSSIADVDMSGATVTSDSSAKTITVTGASVKLQAVAAALLNSEFPLVVPDPNGDFVAGDPLGTVTFTAHTQ
jgi:hypothetical protein